MDVRELRIGNFVSLFGLGETVEFPLTEPRFIRVLNGEYKVEPIPLTEEWLIKFRFGGRPDFKWNGIVGIQIGDGKYYLALKDLSNVLFHSIVEIKYIHQLQNIYFALTGEELTIKQ